MFRAAQMIQDKTQAANNGMSLLRAVTPYWIIWVAPFGRAGKRSSAVLHLWAMTSHYLRGAPSIQPLPDSLNMPISPCRSTNHCPRDDALRPSTSRFAESVNITLKEYS